MFYFCLISSELFGLRIRVSNILILISRSSRKGRVGAWIGKSVLNERQSKQF